MKKKLIDSTKMYLIGDIGNTEIKIFLLDNKFVKIKKIFLKTSLMSKKYMHKKLNILKKKK